MTPEELAQRIHDTFARHAENYDYASAEMAGVPWADVPANHKQLMLNVATAILHDLGFPVAAEGTIPPLQYPVNQILESDVPPVAESSTSSPFVSASTITAPQVLPSTPTVVEGSTLSEPDSPEIVTPTPYAESRERAASADETIPPTSYP